MRSFALAVVGLAAMGHALPALTERQTLGEPTTELAPDTGASTLVAPETVTVGDLIVGKRQKLWLPEFSSEDKENIQDAETELREAREALADTHDPYERFELKRYIDQLEHYLKKVAGIIDIQAPPGVVTTFTPGKRSEAHGKWDHDDDELEKQFSYLAHQYTDKHPSAEVYLILKMLAQLLEASGRKHEDIIFLGPISTEFGISDKAKRQLRDGTGACILTTVNKYQLAWFLLQSIKSSGSDNADIALENFILTSLLSCGVDPRVEVGGLVPNRPTTGAPITPNPTTPGAPMVPNNPVPSTTVRPST